jgi:hypothetical protein
MISSAPFPISIIVIVLVCATVLHPSDAKTTEVKREPPPPTAPDVPLPKIKPMAFKDAKTGILVYFESDGLTAAAIDKNGKVLWHKNPAENSAVSGFTKDGKEVRPVIYQAGSPGDSQVKDMKRRGFKGEFIIVSFSTGEFATLDIKTGEITVLGKN